MCVIIFNIDVFISQNNIIRLHKLGGVFFALVSLFLQPFFNNGPVFGGAMAPAGPLDSPVVVALLKNIKKSQYPYRPMLPHVASRPLIGPEPTLSEEKYINKLH